MIEMMIDLATYSEETRQYALLQERDVHTVAVVAMTGDRGLAGAFNANVVRKAMAIERDLREQGVETRVLAVGRKGIGTLKFRGCRLEKSWQGLSDRPQYTDAKAIAARAHRDVRERRRSTACGSSTTTSRRPSSRRSWTT